MSLSTLDSRSLKTRMTTRGRSQQPRLFLCSLGMVAFAFVAASTIFTVLDAAILYYGGISFRTLAVIAAIFDFISLGALVAFLIQFVWRQGKRWHNSRSSRAKLLLICLLPAVIATPLTLATYVLTQNHKREIFHTEGGHWSLQMPTKFTLWALSSLSQILFFAVAIWMKPVEHQYSGAAEGSMEEQMRETSPPLALEILPAPQVSSSSIPSPTFSNASTQSLSSWRSSLHQVVRPITSRTKLLPRNTSSLRESVSLSSMRTNSLSQQPDGFATWQGSDMDPHMLEAIMQTTPARESISAPSHGTRLDPIPGSRPVSPARALNGPFPDVPATDTEVAPSPAFLSPHNSRPPSPNIDSAYIHPLFRADSPIPPPATTPGTVVVASPLSGQVIPRPAMNRSRANSRTVSPSPLINQTQKFSDDASINNERSPRSSSPPEREMTPPIPDFILSESPRVSSAGTSLRKHSLQGPELTK